MAQRQHQVDRAADLPQDADPPAAVLPVGADLGAHVRQLLARFGVPRSLQRPLQRGQVVGGLEQAELPAAVCGVALQPRPGLLDAERAEPPGLGRLAFLCLTAAVVQAAQVTKDELDIAGQQLDLVLVVPVAGAGCALAGGAKRQRLGAASACAHRCGGQSVGPTRAPAAWRTAS